VARPDPWDERIQTSLALIISSLLDVVTEQHAINDDLSRQVEALTERVERLDARP